MVSETVNSSKTFLVIKELEPGTEYTVRVLAKSCHDSCSIFEDVIRTRAKGEGRGSLPTSISLPCHYP